MDRDSQALAPVPPSADLFAVWDGVAKPAAIDLVMKLGADHPVEPSQLADLIGLDTILSVRETRGLGTRGPNVSALTRQLPVTGL